MFASQHWTLMQSTHAITHGSGQKVCFCTQSGCVCTVAQYVCRTACCMYDSIRRPSTTGGSSSLEQMETDWDVRDGTSMPRESIWSVSDKRHRRAVGLFQPSSDVTDNQPDICCLHPLDHWRLTERREGTPPPPPKKNQGGKLTAKTWEWKKDHFRPKECVWMRGTVVSNLI